MQLSPYLFFDGKCKEAFEFYEKVLRGKIRAVLKYGDAPGAEKVKPEHRDQVIHAALELGNQLLMASDWGSPEPYKKPQGFYVSFSVKEPAEAERVFNALAEGGQVHMPIQQTFFSPRFGMLVDRFGTPWMVNCESQTSNQ